MYHFARTARRAILATAVLGGASVAGSLALTGADRDPMFLARAAVRSLRTVVTGVSIVADYKWTLRDGPVDGDEAAYRALKSEVHLRSAQRILAAAEKNGGVYVKLGQHIAAMEYLLPTEYVQTMRVLQDQCPPTPVADLDAMFRRDRGVGLDDVFDDFDPEPLGVASVAQVHRATLKDGRRVAIKMQHPEIRTFSMLDIELTASFVQMVKILFPEFEFGWLADEMRDNLPLELDFRHEAKNTARVTANFAGSSRLIKVPAVYWADERLLCMEFAEGSRIDDLEYLRQHGISPSQVACELTRAFSDMIFKHGFLHADPHPGNLMVQPRATRTLPFLARFWRPRNFTIVLLDHGLYRELSPAFRHGYAHLWRALIRGDEAGIRDWSRRVAHVDMYHLFACMLTGRSWETIVGDGTNGGGVASERNGDELTSVSSSAQAYFVEIAQVLAQVPRPLLLVFKTNDLLRSVARSLGLSEWASVSVMSAAVIDMTSRRPRSSDEEGEAEEDEEDLPLLTRVKDQLESWAIHAAVWLYESGWM
ncbi:hypothetical protein H9P43_009537 [Blastocladiella emersonii ATCC 22665]|nr:hypothetical protein H9P43_009537 [Blastocladiella emersonii ATCC 22665]